MVKPILPRQISLLPTVEMVQATNPASNNSAPGMLPSGGPEPVQPRKRGRKPGPLSRSAREAQRKLNHSIIEKARRTKINEALAALRQLVPADFSRRLSSGNSSTSSNRHFGTNSDDEIEDEDEDDSGNVEYQGSSPSAGKKTGLSGTTKNGKKREEKEFKLEVLERTVSYLQDLTERYDELKMRHDQLLEMNTSSNSSERHSRCRCFTERRYREYREDIFTSADASRKRSRSDAGSVVAGSISDNDHSSGVTLLSSIGSSDERPLKRHEPLPPISSWLPLSPNASRSTLSPSSAPIRASGDESVSAAVTPTLSSQLPTPPSSTLFQPFFSGARSLTANSTIPSLSLGPTVLPLPSQSSARRPSISLSPSVTPRTLTGGRSTKSAGNNHDMIERSSHSQDASTPASPHTPEDENAASLLLTMRLKHSPVSPKYSVMAQLQGRRPSISSGRVAPASSPTLSPSSLMLPPPEMAYHTSTSASSATSSHRHQVVETPGSLLGLTNHRSILSDV